MSIEKPVDEVERLLQAGLGGLSGGPRLKSCCCSAAASVCVRPVQARASNAVRQVSFLRLRVFKTDFVDKFEGLLLNPLKSHVKFCTNMPFLRRSMTCRRFSKES